MQLFVSSLQAPGLRVKRALADLLNALGIYRGRIPHHMMKGDNVWPRLDRTFSSPDFVLLPAPIRMPGLIALGDNPHDALHGLADALPEIVPPAALSPEIQEILAVVPWFRKPNKQNVQVWTYKTTHKNSDGMADVEKEAVAKRIFRRFGNAWRTKVKLPAPAPNAQ